MNFRTRETELRVNANVNIMCRSKSLWLQHYGGGPSIPGQRMFRLVTRAHEVDVTVMTEMNLLIAGYRTLNGNRK